MSSTSDVVRQLENEYELLIAEIADKSVRPGLQAVQDDLCLLIDKATEAGNLSNSMIESLDSAVRQTVELVGDIQRDIESQLEPIRDALIDMQEDAKASSAGQAHSLEEIQGSLSAAAATSLEMSDQLERMVHELRDEVARLGTGLSNSHEQMTMLLKTLESQATDATRRTMAVAWTVLAMGIVNLAIYLLVR